MSNAHLQSLFSQARNVNNPKVAVSYVPQFSTGEDGKLYKLAAEEDRNKFHILSDAEVEEELRMSQEMANTLKSVNPKKPAKLKTHSVKLGTGSRSKKIEKRAWEKKIKEEQQEKDDNEGNDVPEEASSEDKLLQSVNDLQKKYTANLAVIERLISEKMQMEEKIKSLQQELKKSKKLNRYQSSQQFKKTKDVQLTNTNETIKSVDALKTYYHQNLDLIESLYIQQQSSERKLIACQNQLIEVKKQMEKDPSGKNKPVESIPNEDILASAAETNQKYLRNLYIIEQLFAERKGLTAEVDSLKNQLRSFKRSAAMHETNADVTVNGNKSPPRLGKSILNQTAPGALENLPQSIDDRIRQDVSSVNDDDDDLPSFKDDDETNNREGDEKSPRASVGGSTTKGLVELKRSSSPTLKTSKSKEAYMEKLRESEQKYFEKKRLALEREQQEKLEQEMYEYELERRRLRASRVKKEVVEINGKAKTVVVAEGMRGMAERDKLAEQRRLEREKKRKEKADAEAAEQRKAIELEKKKVERLTKSIAKSRQKEEEQKKKAQEESGDGNDTKAKDVSKEKTPAKPKLSPAEVTEKLEKQRMAWEKKLEKEKQEKKAKLIQTQQDKSVDEMLKRQEERERLLREKHKERELEAKKEAEKAAEKERKRKEKLRLQAQLNGEAAKEKAAKAKLEETMRLEEEQKKAEKKKKKKSGAKESDEPTYKNAAEMIAAMKNKSKGPQEKAISEQDKEGQGIEDIENQSDTHVDNDNEGEQDENNEPDDKSGEID